MFLKPSMKLFRYGKPKFKRFTRDSYGRTKRIHAYVTFGPTCNSHCGFCRNHNFSKDLMKQNYEELRKTLRKYSPYIHTMVFGGGEPLLYADKLYSVISNRDVVDYDIERYIITNGTRKQFIKEVGSCKMCRYLNGILLSRHHYDDDKNAKIFGNHNLLTTNDIKILCPRLKDKMEFVITCTKGYIDSVDEILKFIEWGRRLGIDKFLFNDLQKDVTNEEYWNQNQINENVFNDCEQELLERDYRIGISVCFTAGYDITTYTKYGVRVGFKRYHHSKEETMKKWKESRKYTYDLSIMPNGDIFSDWTNEHKIK